MTHVTCINEKVTRNTLIHKNDDKTEIDNYRPIGLTNTDYRILAFILANRLQNVIKDIVGPDQVAYIKNCFIGTNIRLVQDLFNLYVFLVYLYLWTLKKAFGSIVTVHKYSRKIKKNVSLARIGNLEQTCLERGNKRIDSGRLSNTKWKIVLLPRSCQTERLVSISRAMCPGIFKQ